MSDDNYCPKCEGDGSYSELAPCTTFDRDCACNGPRVLVDPCEACGGSGECPSETRDELRQATRARDELRAERDSLQREVERHRAGWVTLYRDSSTAAATVGRICDEVIDPSGRLLGVIRREVAAADALTKPDRIT